MAGRDHEFRGDATLAPGVTVGLLEQEPHLDESKDVRANVLEGVGRPRRARRALQRACGQLLGRDGRRVRAPAGRDRRRRRLEPRRHDRARDGRAALPAGRRGGRPAVGRRAPPRRAVPPAALPARPAAAGRADQPPRRGVGRVAGAPPRRVQGHRRRGHPRPLLPRQRRRLDPRARPRSRDPLPRQLLGLARAEAGAPRPEREAGDRAPANDRRRARMGAHEPQGQAHQVQGAPRQLRGAARGRGRRQARPGPDPHPRRPAPRRRRDRGRATCARASASAC